MAALVAALDDAETHLCVRAERALLREVQGGCQIPRARQRDGGLELESCVFSADGAEFVRRSLSGPADGAEAGRKAILLEAGADRLLRLAGRAIG